MGWNEELQIHETPQQEAERLRREREERRTRSPGLMPLSPPVAMKGFSPRLLDVPGPAESLQRAELDLNPVRNALRGALREGVHIGGSALQTLDMLLPFNAVWRAPMGLAKGAIQKPLSPSHWLDTAAKSVSYEEPTYAPEVLSEAGVPPWLAIPAGLAADMVGTGFIGKAMGATAGLTRLGKASERAPMYESYKKLQTAMQEALRAGETKKAAEIAKDLGRMTTEAPGERLNRRAFSLLGEEKLSPDEAVKLLQEKEARGLSPELGTNWASQGARGERAVVRIPGVWEGPSPAVNARVLGAVERGARKTRQAAEKTAMGRFLISIGKDTTGIWGAQDAETIARNIQNARQQELIDQELMRVQGMQKLYDVSPGSRGQEVWSLAETPFVEQRRLQPLNVEAWRELQAVSKPVGEAVSDADYLQKATAEMFKRWSSVEWLVKRREKLRSLASEGKITSSQQDELLRAMNRLDALERSPLSGQLDAAIDAVGNKVMRLRQTRELWESRNREMVARKKPIAAGDILRVRDLAAEERSAMALLNTMAKTKAAREPLVERLVQGGTPVQAGQPGLKKVADAFVDVNDYMLRMEQKAGIPVDRLWGVDVRYMPRQLTKKAREYLGEREPPSLLKTGILETAESQHVRQRALPGLSVATINALHKRGELKTWNGKDVSKFKGTLLVDDAPDIAIHDRAMTSSKMQGGAAFLDHVATKRHRTGEGTVEILEALKKEGVVLPGETTKRWQGVRLPEPEARYVAGLAAKMTKADEVDDAEALGDLFMHLWKKGVTSRPGFASRNIRGAIFKNYAVGGTTGVRPWTETLRLLMMDADELAEPFTFSRAHGREITGQELLREMTEHGAAKSSTEFGRHEYGTMPTEQRRLFQDAISPPEDVAYPRLDAAASKGGATGKLASALKATAKVGRQAARESLLDPTDAPLSALNFMRSDQPGLAQQHAPSRGVALLPTLGFGQLGNEAARLIETGVDIARQTPLGDKSPIIRGVRHLGGGGDDWAKAAAFYDHRVLQGKSAEEAGRLARLAQIDYGRNTRIQKHLRKAWMPWQAWVFGNTANTLYTLARRPQTMAQKAAVYRAVASVMEDMTGGESMDALTLGPTRHVLPGPYVEGNDPERQRPRQRTAIDMSAEDPEADFWGFVPGIGDPIKKAYDQAHPAWKIASGVLSNWDAYREGPIDRKADKFRSPGTRLLQSVTDPDMTTALGLRMPALVKFVGENAWNPVRQLNVLNPGNWFGEEGEYPVFAPALDAIGGKTWTGPRMGPQMPGVKRLKQWMGADVYSPALDTPRGSDYYRFALERLPTDLKYQAQTYRKKGMELDAALQEAETDVLMRYLSLFRDEFGGQIPEFMRDEMDAAKDKVRREWTRPESAVSK